jgi:hypothetical protein
MNIIGKNQEAIKCLNVFYEAFDEITLLSLLNKIEDLQDIEHSHLVWKDFNPYTGERLTYYELECVDQNSNIFNYDELCLINLFEKFGINLKIKFPPMELMDIEVIDFIFF